MTPDRDLFDYVPAPYRGEPPAQAHSPTSQAAATSIKQSIGPLHKEILEYLSQNTSGATDEQMQDELIMPANTERPRRRELELLGKVQNSGKTRQTRSGRCAVVWRLT